MIGSKAPKKDGKPQHVTWTGEQAQVFRRLGRNPAVAAVAVGARNRDAARELMALCWQHVDLDAGIVSVEWSTAQLGNRLVTTSPKNHERRKIALDARTVAALRMWRKVQAQERLAWGCSV